MFPNTAAPTRCTLPASASQLREEESPPWGREFLYKGREPTGLPVGGGGNSAARRRPARLCLTAAHLADVLRVGPSTERTTAVDLFFRSPHSISARRQPQFDSAPGRAGAPGPAAAAAVPPSARRSLAPPSIPATAPALGPRAAAKPRAEEAGLHGQPAPRPRAGLGRSRVLLLLGRSEPPGGIPAPP